MSQSSRNPPDFAGELHEVTTHWTMVRALAREDHARWEQSWNYLVRRYRTPMHNLVRRDLPALVGRSVPEAEIEDVVQAFLTDAVEKQWLVRADPSLGRFRGFLKTLIKRYLHNYAAHVRRQKRDPANARVVSLSQVLPDGELLIDPAAEQIEDTDFDRDWARAVVSAAVDRLERRNPTQASVIHNELQGQPLNDDALAVQLKVKPASIRVLRMRARKSFRAAVKAEVTATIADPGDVNDELARIKSLLADPTT